VRACVLACEGVCVCVCVCVCVHAGICVCIPDPYLQKVIHTREVGFQGSGSRVQHLCARRIHNAKSHPERLGDVSITN
jgi:hypothetical protein